jgi:hypothetical protein
MARAAEPRLELGGAVEPRLELGGTVEPHLELSRLELGSATEDLAMAAACIRMGGGARALDHGAMAGADERRP